jgi:hypothetical protein
LPAAAAPIRRHRIRMGTWQDGYVIDIFLKHRLPLLRRLGVVP